MLRRLWVAAILFTVYASTLPFSFVDDSALIGEHWAQAIQRSAVSEYANLSRADVLQNVLLFIPIGAIGVAASHRRGRMRALLITVFSAAVLSATCELAQLFTVDRLTSMWDLDANVAGALFGAALALIAIPLGARLSTAIPVAPSERRHSILLLCAASLVVVAACEPFDITLDVGTVWLKVKPFVTSGVMSFRPVSDELLTAFRFAILAVALNAWLRLRRASGSSSVILTAAACAVLALVLEATQFLITSRSPALQDVVAAASGVLIGVTVGPSLARAVPVPLLVTVSTVIAAIPFYLQPFDLSPVFGQIALVPFLSYYQFTSLQTVSHVVELMLIYAPIGFAIVWTDRSSKFARVLVVVAPIAAALEYSQGWVVGRYPDVTDFGVAILGGMAGAALAQRLNAQFHETAS